MHGATYVLNNNHIFFLLYVRNLVNFESIPFCTTTGYFLPFFSSLLKKRGKKKVAKPVLNHSFFRIDLKFTRNLSLQLKIKILICLFKIILVLYYHLTLKIIPRTTASSEKSFSLYGACEAMSTILAPSLNVVVVLMRGSTTIIKLLKRIEKILNFENIFLIALTPSRYDLLQGIPFYILTFLKSWMRMWM